jgi:hypothetical protein
VQHHSAGDRQSGAPAMGCPVESGAAGHSPVP